MCGGKDPSVYVLLYRESWTARWNAKHAAAGQSDLGKSGRDGDVAEPSSVRPEHCPLRRRADLSAVARSAKAEAHRDIRRTRAVEDEYPAVGHAAVRHKARPVGADNALIRRFADKHRRIGGKPLHAEIAAVERGGMLAGEGHPVLQDPEMLRRGLGQTDRILSDAEDGREDRLRHRGASHRA